MPAIDHPSPHRGVLGFAHPPNSDLNVDPNLSPQGPKDSHDHPSLFGKRPGDTSDT
jgi:hypothetical protein